MAYVLYQPIDKWLPKTEKTGFDSSYLQRSEISCNKNVKFQKFDGFTPNMHSISILFAFQQLPLRTYFFAKAYFQSAISGLKEKSKYTITNCNHIIYPH